MGENNIVVALIDEFVSKLSNPEFWIAIGTSLIRIVLIILVAWAAVAIVKAAVNRIFQRREGSKLQLQRRVDTLRVLTNNVAQYIIYFVAILLVLKELNFDLQPILVSAGVVGLAVGFGAQNLVRDVISGFFIIFEDQFAVGDLVTINQMTGTVQEIGLRITKIKSWTGEVHIFPNGSINQVTNYSIENSIAIVDVKVAYEEDLDRVQQVLGEVAKRAQEECEEIVKEPEVLGVQGFGTSEVIIRVVAECRPTTNHVVARKLRAMIKEEFAARGIAIPYPKMVYVPSENQSLQG